MSKASLDTFFEQVNSGKTETDKVVIYNFIKKHPFTTIEVMRVKLDLPHQTITARLSDLLDFGVLDIHERKKLSENDCKAFYSMFTVQEDSFKIENNRKLRELKKFKKKLKSILSFGFISESDKKILEKYLQ